MPAPAAARRYARALFALAEEEGRVEPVRDELLAISAVLADHAELRDAILRPLHPAPERRAALVALCKRLGSSDTVRRFASFLVDQRRVIDFESIRAAYEQLADEAAGRTRARVVSAAPLRAEQVARLRGALAVRTGLEVELETSVDPDLIGGAIASVGGVVFDGSLRTQLAQLRADLTKGT